MCTSSDDSGDENEDAERSEDGEEDESEEEEEEEQGRDSAAEDEDFDPDGESDDENMTAGALHGWTPTHLNHPCSSSPAIQHTANQAMYNACFLKCSIRCFLPGVRAGESTEFLQHTHPLGV